MGRPRGEKSAVCGPGMAVHNDRALTLLADRGAHDY